MKRILLISRCPPWPLHLGARLIVWHLCRELSQRGHVIDLLALHNDDDAPGQVDEYRQFFRRIQLFREPPRRAIDYLRRVMLPSARFADSPETSFCPPLWHAVADSLARNEYDLVHCFGGVSVYEYAPLFAHLPRLITPYESHTLFLRSAARQGDLSARLRLPIARRFERFMFTPYDRAVVISDVDAAMLRGLNPALNVSVIPNGIDLAQFPVSHAEREPCTLVFVGNYAYAPNQDAARLLAERILPAVQAQIRSARLRLVGANPPDWLRGMANDCIEVTGRVPDVAPYLARASAFVCPLRVGAGLKNKLLEALAMGAPVVSTPLSVDGIAVADGESALIADVENMADAVIRLLRDESLRRRLSRQGRALIESRYTWTRTADAYERLYDEIRAG